MCKVKFRLLHSIGRSPLPVLEKSHHPAQDVEREVLVQVLLDVGTHGRFFQSTGFLFRVSAMSLLGDLAMVSGWDAYVD
ncbi:hypothetical protein D0911_08660 [Zhongshania marina]|uniref:Uncharacterized protein n=1 Tax=Zhongshania marina TaxID=2304603 RepID=A0ABX9W3H7_9GAMM|nr:hypothetical protein D0911_08660 [Zhongshania marina]